MIPRRRWRAWLTEEAKAELERAAAAAHPKESGGILVGVLAGGRPWIARAVEIRSKKSATAYYELPAGKRQQVVKRLRRDDPRLGYLGEWHTHPLDLPPSLTDLISISRLASDPAAGCPRPLLVVARRVGAGYEFDARQLHRRSLRAVRLLVSGPLPERSAVPGGDRLSKSAPSRRKQASVRREK